jgi:Leucine-rich repeat (LRR) protein
MALILFTGVNAQVIDIPDANFKTKLLSSGSTNLVAYDNAFNYLKIDANNNGEIEVDEALKVNWLMIDNSNIFDFSGIEKFLNITVLKCSNNQATVLNISGLGSLASLTCSNSKLTRLIASNCIKLNELNIDNNPISSLDISGCSSYESLNYFGTSLQELNVAGCIKLYTLNIQNTLLSSLDVSTLSSLINFSCSNNKLQSLNFGDFSNSLAWVNCSGNVLTEVKISNMPFLHDIDCSDNNIASATFDNLPLLTTLNCINNQLISIDLNGSQNLDNLYFSNNKIVRIDLNAFTNLRRLYCDHNQLQTIDAGKLNKLEELRCNNNNLTSLFLKNGSYTYSTDFNNNPYLEYICIDEGYEMSFFQKKIDDYGYKKCNLNSYCSFNPGGNFFTIEGRNAIDIDKNGCDTSDFGYSNLNFSISEGTLMNNIVASLSGNYCIPVKEGVYTISPILENSTYFTVLPSSVNVAFPAQSSPFVQDFCITPNGIHQDVEITLLPTIPARPGFDTTYKIIYKNKGTIVQSGSVSLSFNDAVLDYVVANPAANNLIADKLTWDYTNLQPFESREITVTLNVNSLMEIPAVNIGDRLSFNALITPISSDEKPVDNSSVLRQSVVGSFEMNDKTCLEGDIITPILIGEYVHYLIRFENTGTYPIENIVVKDMIDLTKFDISTLVPTKASHSYVTKISDGNKVEFIFEKINLLFDDANNDGYIAFKIKTLPTFVAGDSFNILIIIFQF